MRLRYGVADVVMIAADETPGYTSLVRRESHVGLMRRTIMVYKVW